MKIKSFLLSVIILIIFGCSSNTQKPSHLRIGQFLFAKESVELKFKKKDKIILSKNLNYGDLTEYETISSGIYEVEVIYNENLVLKKKIGIGTDGIYTLVMNGFPQQDQKKNQKTTKMKLHEIVEGEEAIYPNGNLPQMRILNDEFECGKNEAKIRWIHLAAGVEKVNATAETKDSKSTDLSSLTYPRITKNFTVSPKPQILVWKLKGDKVEVSTKELNIKPDYLYTFFLIGNEEKYIDSLKVVVGETPKKEF
ncbi:DUF4397 domain-containing protein [Christiangramia crocea]|uniref:DUF4397 domain-containing protein n=1 Tax=Christiangramia crocea TaxID=2904124 RepID=A0A9X1UWI5_9FLAO|nr:DUF4397 domain-containing protein [Gramella crocea]MCG9971425.1 DUF4397 domain-containing protein [Gramella crocea]